MNRLAQRVPDVIVAVDALNISTVRLYGVTERGLEFLEVDSGDPPNICGRGPHGWAIEPCRLNDAVRRAESAGMTVAILDRAAASTREAVTVWRASGQAAR
jgi:hypothetical protein